jgi:hypothetical protein
MVNWEEIRELLRKRPFQPFRVHLNDGRSFKIEYPELNIVRKTFIAIGVPTPNDPDPAAEHVYHFDLKSIASIELLSEPSPWKPKW